MRKVAFDNPAESCGSGKVQKLRRFDDFLGSRRFRSGGLALLALLLLSACQTPVRDVGEVLPKLPTEAWSVADAEATLDAEAVNGWVNTLDDPGLDLVVRQALAENFDLRARAERLEATWQTVAISGSTLFPQVSVDAGASRRRTEILDAESDSFDLTGRISWDVDIWGRLRNTRTAAEADFIAEEAFYDAARLALAGRTAQQWYRSVEARLQLELAQNNVELLETIFELIRQRFDAGIVRALDVLLARAQLESARRDLLLRQRFFNEAVRQLEVLVGEYPDRDREVPGDLQIVLEPVPGGLPADLLLRRPDLLALEARLVAANERYAAARRERLPGLRLTASGGTSGDELRDVLNDSFSVYTLAAAISQPIFQGKRLAAVARQAESREEAALLDYAQAILDAFREVETLLVADGLLEGEVAALLIASEDSVAAEELAIEEYGNGLTDIITVLEAQRRSVSSRSALLQARRVRLETRIELFLALGGSPLVGSTSADR